MKCILKQLGFCLLLFSAQLSLAQQKPIRCTIIGQVIDRPYSSSLILLKENDDPRVNGQAIPIVDGKFTYQFETDVPRSYTLIFDDEFQKGAMRPVLFFAEADSLFLTLYPEDRHHENQLQGGAINQLHVALDARMRARFDFTELADKQNALRESNGALMPEANELLQQINAAQEGDIRDSLRNRFHELEDQDQVLSDKAKALSKEMGDLYKAMVAWKAELVEKEISLVTYRELLQLLRMANSDTPEPLPIAVPSLIATFERSYKTTFPHHPYTATIETLIEAMQKVRKGGRYIDISAADFAGNKVKLSEHISGKVALINLWASWCGPCRWHGKEMIPLYDKYKDRGFTVVGIARERDKESGINAAKADNYPWLNLLELNDENNIWNTYGLGNAGGGMFLVDQSGEILAVSPTADELDQILTRLFN